MSDDPTHLSIISNWALAAVGGTVGLLIAAVRWAYMRDSKKFDDALAGIKQDHGKLIEMVNEINATRPMRVELTEAVDDLRKEVAVEFASLRSEIRTDINGLRTDVTTRLDTLIRMQGGK